MLMLMNKKLFFFVTLFFAFTLISAHAQTLTIKEGQRIEKAGTYYYPFSVIGEDGVESSTERKATIIFPYSVINQNLLEGIDAKDIHTNLENLDSLSQLELIDLARAHAWSIETGESVPIHSVSVHTENLKPGSAYKVTFATGKNTKISVDTYLSDNEVVPAIDKYINLKPYHRFNPRNLFWLLLLILIMPLLVFMISFAFINKKYKRTINLLFEQGEEDSIKTI